MSANTESNDQIHQNKRNFLGLISMTFQNNRLDIEEHTPLNTPI